MDVGLGVEGDVVVHHQGDAVHIQAPGGHIGGHKHVHMAALEPVNRAFALALGDVAVEHGHVVTLGLQGFGHRHGDRLGAGKNDHPLLGFGFQYPAEGLQFLGRIHREVALADAAGIVALLANGDFGRIVEVLAGDTANFRRHGGREQHHLALLGQLAEHPFDVVDEAHAQHLIGLIEHQGAQAGKIEGALAHVVHHPPGSADHDLDAALEPGDLIAEVGAAIHG